MKFVDDDDDDDVHGVSKKRGVELFAITSTDFENSFTVENGSKLPIKSFNISCHFLKNLVALRCET